MKRPQPSWFDRLKRVGPTIIVAAVVLGPGSIVNASRVGCEFGYALLWVVPLAGILMAGMTVAAMTTGVLDHRTPCTWIAERLGRPLALLVGGCLFIAITLYQASNNNAMIMAWRGLMPTDPTESSSASPLVGLALFNVVVIALLWAGRRGLYRKLERSMMVLVGIMLIAFVGSMIAVKPDLGGVISGLVPSLPSPPTDVSSTDSTTGGTGAVETAKALSVQSWLGIAALIATTFSVAGAFFQNYQVREKGWGKADLPAGMLDAIVGIGTLSFMTMVLFITAATALYPGTPVSELSDAIAVAAAMEPLFGQSARFVFSIGVMAGAISSFVVNALIGGVAICDGLGKSCSFDGRPVRIATVVTLLAGFLVAGIATFWGVNLVRFIVVAQSLTVLAFPVLALSMLGHAWSIRDRGVSAGLLGLVGCGLLLVCGMSARTLWLLAS